MGESLNGDDQRANEYSEGYADIDELRIGYCRYGHGPYFIATICGAVGCYKKDWPETLLRHFDPNLVTIVCVDPPGYGTSRPPDRAQEINRCLKDAGFVIKLMKQLELTPFSVIGWSEGARTAIHVTGQGRALVKKVVILAAGTRVDERAARAFRGMRNTDQWLEQNKQPYLAFYSEDFLRKQWADLCDVVQRVFDDLGGRFPSDHVLPTIKVPMLVMNGGMDRFCMDPKHFLNVVAKSRLEVHAQGGHDFYVKYPKWFSEKIQSFIQEP